MTVHGKTIASDANGEFQVNDIPEGAYTVTVSAPGFQSLARQVTVTAGKEPVLHLQLEVAGVNASVEVSGAMSRLNTQTSTVQTMVSPQEIAHTAGADQTNSLAMITDFTPGAYMVHDMLHMRGGHQVNWFFDGIPVINTNIAANVAPLINPKNVEELEVERGGYSSEYGDRTYGFFNVVTPSGFERNNEGELIASAGNFYSTDDQFNFGSHTERFAYYASVDGNRSELGLAPPVSQVIHDQDSGVGGFLSLLYNLDCATTNCAGSSRCAKTITRFPTGRTIRRAGIRDLDLEQDYLGGFHWTHTLRRWRHVHAFALLTTSTARITSAGRNDTPFVLNDNQPLELLRRRVRSAGAKEAAQLARRASKSGASMTTPSSA